MKKIFALILVCAMCLSGMAVAETGIASTPENTLVVGTSSMNGDFLSGFTQSTYDEYVRILVHAYYDTFEVTSAGEYVENPTVLESWEAVANEDGSKTYTFKLCEDLKWSNGSDITAKDYVFDLLWRANPNWVLAGASSDLGFGLKGYTAYNSGESEVFEGVRLIDDYTFSATIAAEKLPYFYEYNYVAIPPLCMEVYAPGCDIVSDENGSSFSEGYDILTAMQNVAATERFNPTVGCGPYKLISFENDTATLEINPEFKGDLQGNKPTIQYIVQRAIPSETDVDALIAGEVDMLNKISTGAKIEQAKAASDKIYTHSYFRNGYTMLVLSCDWGPTKDVNVRWALANLIDRSALVDYALAGYGGTVNANYGFAQWMYDYAGEELEDELQGFNLNIEKANEYLDKSEWIYEADGVTPFDASKASTDGTYMRHNAAGEMLTINHTGADNNTVTSAIEIQFQASAPLAGVNLTVTPVDFSTLLKNMQFGYELSDEERQFCSFNISQTFGAIYDPYQLSFHSDKVKTMQNVSQIGDPELDALIENLIYVEPGDNDTFVDNWIQYELKWQELMPQIPLYSNEEFDFASNSVQGLETSPFWYYADCICEMTKN